MCANVSVCAELPLQSVLWAVQLSDSATGGKCCSVSLFAPSLTPYITEQENLRGLVSFYVFLFSLPLLAASLFHLASLLTSPFLGIQLHARLKEGSMEEFLYQIKCKIHVLNPFGELAKKKKKKVR